jgi:hypothetical protein
MVQLRPERQPTLVRWLASIDGLHTDPVYCADLGDVHDVRVQTLRESAVLFRKLSW